MSQPSVKLPGYTASQMSRPTAGEPRFQTPTAASRNRVSAPAFTAPPASQGSVKGPGHSRSTGSRWSAETSPGHGPSDANPPRFAQPKFEQPGLRSEKGGPSTSTGSANPLLTAPSSGRPTLSDIRKRIADGVKHRPAMNVVDLHRTGPADARSSLERSTRRQFSERLQSGDLERLAKGDVARKIKLSEQYRMHEKGDVARRLGLDGHAAHVGHAANAANIPGPHGHDWRVQHHYRGLISPSYVHDCFGFHYCGPFYYPRYCWYPRWTHWVSWSWHYSCDPLWDPRPLWCRPVVYVPAPVWVWWEVPVWRPLPVVTCGTWVDVEPAIVDAEYDLELLAIRFVDPGHPEEHLGPRYRVWFRNNSNRPMTQPFDVLLLASADERLADDLPQGGLRVTSIQAGEVQSTDIRLPVEVYSMGKGEAGQPAPFSTLHALVDANREVSETSEVNNGVKLAPEEVLPVDPAAFELEPSTAAGGSEVVLAGEGFGPEPGKVLVHLGGIEMEAEILGWYDLGVRLALPELPLASPTGAELIVIRGDGAAANPLNITITPLSGSPEPIPVPPGTPQ